MPATIDLRQADPVVGTYDESLPVFTADDILNLRSKRMIDAVRSACLETGFFCIELADAERRLIRTTMRQMQTFFALDDEHPVKRDARPGGGGTGWIRRYTEPAYQPGTISSLESFDIGAEDLADGEFWPRLEGFREDVLDCWNDYLQLADAILEVLALAAGIPADFLVRNCRSRALNTMRLLHYAADIARSDEREVGIAAHTDFECITLLYQSAPGLELLNTNNHWLDAPIRNGRVVILLGDMLERWTNGFFRATGHRVRDTNEQRFSIVMFIAANNGVEVAPLDRFISSESPARYAPVTQSGHIDSEVRRARENAARLNRPSN
jgi:isopenicillin N synthase-like dioxygenase